MKTIKIAYKTALFAAFIVVLLPTGCSHKEQDSQSRKKTPVVAVEIVNKGELVRTLDLTGEVVPVEEIQISSTVEGPIGFCPWREGDRVEIGAKLVEIDRELYRTEVKAAEAALEVTKAKLADMKAGTRPEEISKAEQNVRELDESAQFAQSDMDRIAKLVESGSLPGEELEKAKVNHIGAQSKLAAAKRQLEMLEAGFTKTAIAVQEASVKESAARLELAKARLAECVINAPFAGTITRVYIRKGDMAAMKMPLMEMADFSSLVIRCAIPETHASQVRVGMAAQAQLDAMPGKPKPAEISLVYPSLDPQTRTRTIELTIREKVDLAPGMFGRISVILESVPDAITVPVQAVIVTPAGGKVAFVAAEGKAVQRKIQTGIEEGDRVQILSGLKPGEEVIISGQENLKDGVEIRLLAPPAEGQSKSKPDEKSPEGKPSKAGEDGK